MINVKIMSVIETFKNIYNGPFFQYLRISEKLDESVCEQSKLVDVLFLLEIHFLDLTQKYKKPIHEQEENIFLQPITVEIERIKTFRIESNSSPCVYHLIYISESTKIFEWIKHANIEEFLGWFRSDIEPHVSKIKNELLQLDRSHSDWFNAWSNFLEELSEFLLSYYKNGLSWNGSEKLPEQVLHGDILAMYKSANHQKLFQQINQGENISRLLRQVNAENVQPNID